MLLVVPGVPGFTSVPGVSGVPGHQDLVLALSDPGVSWLVTAGARIRSQNQEARSGGLEGRKSGDQGED